MIPFCMVSESDKNLLYCLLENKNKKQSRYIALSFTFKSNIVYYKRSTSRVFFVYCVALSLWVLNQYFSKRISLVILLIIIPWNDNDSISMTNVWFSFLGTHKRDFKKIALSSMTIDILKFEMNYLRHILSFSKNENRLGFVH